MSTGFDFTKLDLSGVEDVRQSSISIKPGVYNSTITGAEIRDDAKGCKRLYLEWTVNENGGKARENFILFRPERLPDYYDGYVKEGMQKLKSICKNGGLPNPDKPGDVANLKGLQMSVTYEIPWKNDKKRNNEKFQTWLNEQGDEVKNACEPKRYGAYGPLKNGADGHPAVIIQQDHMDNGSGAPIPPPDLNDNLDGLVPDEPPPF
tara:strand:+ start:64 stop:681 length:618 start_codon:yes stop_codon:yes gene_type:complete